MSEAIGASGGRESAVPGVEQGAYAPRSPGNRRWIAYGVVALLLAGVGIWYAVTRQPDDLTRMQGEWQVVAGERPTPVVVRIENDRWMYFVGEEERSVERITLNPAADPKEIDLTSLEPDGEPKRFTSGPGIGSEMKRLGIYKWEDGALTVALNPAQDGGTRPTAFDDPDAPPALTLMRVK